MVPYIHQTIVNFSVLLSLLSASIVARASVSTKTKTIKNLLVLLSQLNAYVVTETNVSAKTVTIITQRAKQQSPYLPSPLNVWLNTKLSIP